MSRRQRLYFFIVNRTRLDQRKDTEAGKGTYDAACNRRGTDDDHGQKPGVVVKIERLFR